MSHPNVELASELKKCINAKNPSDVEALAVSGKRKGYLLLDESTGVYVLTAKGLEFMSKWGRSKP